MDSNSAVLGIHSEKLNSAFWILKLIGKNVWFIDEEGNKVKWDEKLHDHIDQWADSTDLEIQLYDDLTIEGKVIQNWIRTSIQDLYEVELTFVKNKQIKVGLFSDFIICAASIGSSSSSYEIPEETMRDLYEWKRELIQAGRLPNDAEVKMIGNN